MNINKSSSKPSISSSPNRSEKFQPPPPPLTRFLRTNASNRSRGRSLSSPMFSSVVLRKKKSDIETQEPTSPKVTCIGQVRVRRSSKPKPNPNPNPNPNPTKAPLTCKWLQRFLFCSPFSRKPKKPYNPFWHRWFKGYHHRKVPQVLEHSSRRHFNFNFNFNPTREEPEEAKAKQASIAVVEEEEKEEESSVFAPPPSSPPKNALLLMRCRSAPHRSGNRLGTVSLSLSPAAGGAKEAEREEQEEDDDEEKMAQLGASSRPLILTRCKSEPASRSGSKIALVDHRQPHVFFD
ncbi:hypothetical protein AAC387_Pa07g3446 [Persea americana]